MKRLSVAAFLLAVVAVSVSGAALWRTRDISSTPTPTTVSTSSDDATSTTGVPLVSVPSVVGANAYGAGGALKALKLNFQVVTTPSVTVAAQHVISQNPDAGTQVPEGSVVNLTVSSGPP